MPELRIDSLTFRNQGPYHLTIAPEQCICITGVSGSGKSLLLRSIADLDKHEGKIFLDNLEAKSMPATQWRRQVGMLPAESAWWSDIVRDHITNDCTHLLPHLGFEADVLNWQVKRLSTGERQRLAIIRLLAQTPKALLLDEPTASLDSDNVYLVETLIKDYLKTHQAPVLWISHDPEQVQRVADKHFILHPNRLMESPEDME